MSNLKNVRAVVVIAILMSTVLILRTEGYGADYRAYLAAAEGEAGYISDQGDFFAFYYPYYWLPIFEIFTLPDYLPSLILWNLINLLGMVYACRVFKTPEWAMLNPFTFGVLHAGQITGVLVGLLAYMWQAGEKHQWIRAGVGLLAPATKPQWGIPIFIWYLWKNRQPRLFIIPGAVILLSFAVYGFWVPELVDRIQSVPTIATSMNDGFQWWLMFFWLPLFLLELEPIKQLQWIQATTVITMPYFLFHDLALFTPYSLLYMPAMWLTARLPSGDKQVIAYFFYTVWLVYAVGIHSEFLWRQYARSTNDA